MLPHAVVMFAVVQFASVMHADQLLSRRAVAWPGVSLEPEPEPMLAPPARSVTSCASQSVIDCFSAPNDASSRPSRRNYRNDFGTYCRSPVFLKGRGEGGLVQ